MAGAVGFDNILLQPGALREQQPETPDDPSQRNGADEVAPERTEKITHDYPLSQHWGFRRAKQMATWKLLCWLLHDRLKTPTIRGRQTRTSQSRYQFR